ncbi:MAG: hypothetical protein GY810_10435 [Aureispira sp.]|nr:hypothetical protein [Aureispira sp.]
MREIKKSVIKEIGKQIAIGNTCYLQRYTGKVTIIDNSTEDIKLIAAQEQTLLELERKMENYVKIEKPSIENRLAIMKDFLDELPDKSVRKQLSNALKRNNPVRNFKKTIESDIELTQHWSNFKVKEYQQWVSNCIIDAYNY